VDAVEATGRGAPPDSSRGEAENRQLGKADDRVLLRRQRRNRQIQRSLVEKRYSWLRFSTRLGHRPMLQQIASHVGSNFAPE
jgi:hypothetical protein